MSSHPPVDPRSRPRLGLLGLAFVLTFLAGLAVAAWSARRYGLFAPVREPVATAQPVPTAPPVATPVDPPAPDLATLTAREAVLAAQLAALEARVAVIDDDTAAAGAQAGRAEAMLAAAAARRALDHGQPLGPLEQQLRLRFPGARQAVEVVAAAALHPVTLEDLRLAFDRIAPDLRSGDRRFWPSLRREIDSLVVLRRADSPSPLPAARLERARRLLDAGQVEAALAEVRMLPGAARAQGWAEAARRYVDARRALDVLESVALAPPPPATAPTPAD